METSRERGMKRKQENTTKTDKGAHVDFVISTVLSR